MKKTLCLLLISISLLGYAQNFQLTDSRGNPYENEYTISATITEEDLNFIGEYVTEITVQNLTDSELMVKTLRTNVAVVDEKLVYVCFGGCWMYSKLDIDCLVEEESAPFTLHLDTLVKEKFGRYYVKLEFWTAEDQADKITLYVDTEMVPLGVKEASTTNVSLSAYPNPAPSNSIINVSYSISNNNSLIIRNLLGADVLNMPLNPHENKISIDVSTLKQGVYFYAIENKNQILIAKKLIVK